MADQQANWQHGLYPWDVITNTCQCGHHINHQSVGVRKSFTALRQFAILLGVTPVPSEVAFICRDCGQTLASSKDSAICHFYV